MKGAPRRTVLQDFGEHVRLSAEAMEWAQKCIDLEAAGKKRQAQAAKKRAREILERVIEIERRHAHRSPHD